MKKIQYCCLVLLMCVLAGTLTYDVSQKTKPTETVVLSASWTYNYGDVEDLTEHSDLIAYVSVRDLFSYDDDGIPLTRYTMSIDELYHGEDVDEINVIMTGGNIDNKLYELDDDPLMEIDDKFLIFARKNNSGTYTILSGSQGRFVVVDNKVYSLNAHSESVRTANMNSNINVNGVELSTFVQQVKSYIEE